MKLKLLLIRNAWSIRPCLTMSWWFFLFSWRLKLKLKPNIDRSYSIGFLNALTRSIFSKVLFSFLFRLTEFNWHWPLQGCPDWLLFIRENLRPLPVKWNFLWWNIEMSHSMINPKKMVQSMKQSLSALLNIEFDAIQWKYTFNESCQIVLIVITATHLFAIAIDDYRKVILSTSTGATKNIEP